MILNETEYNPFNCILALLTDEFRTLTVPTFNEIRKELFSAGVCCESDVEVEQCLEIMRELDIVNIERAKNGRILIKRGINGKNQK